jgi:hypothetical protein
MSHIMKERKLNSLVNPAIFPAFRRIENHALAYIGQKMIDKDEYERCKMVIDKMSSIDSSRDFEPAEEYYEFLKIKGFELPPYRLKTPPTEEQIKRAMEEQDRLWKLRLKFLIQNK